MDRTVGFAVMVNERLSFEENCPQKSGDAAVTATRGWSGPADASESTPLHRPPRSPLKNRTGI